MNGLKRLTRPTEVPADLAAQQPYRSPTRTEDLYQPLDPGDMSVVPPLDETWTRGCRRPHACCFDTNGRAFNFVVGLVVLSSSILVGLEADLGLLGPGSAMHWGSLDSDMGQLSMPHEEAKLLRAEVLQGVEQDQALQVRLRKEATKDLDKVGVHNVDIPEIPERLEPAAYTVCEYAVVAFFTLELCLRMCDQRWAFFSNPWSVLDTAVVVLGMLDVLLPLVCGPDPSPDMLTSMAFLRTLRVLRVARLLRVSLALRVLARAFLNAFAAMAWISAIVLILNFVLAILLTTFVGQNAFLWEAKASDVTEWFGSIGGSMRTLFVIMTLSGWDAIASVLSEVFPPAAVSLALVTYVVASFFTVLSLATGVVSDSFMTAQRDEEAFKKIQLEEHRAAFANALASVLSSSTQLNRGFLSRDEYAAALEAHPVLLSKLRRIDIHTTVDELLQLFDRLCQESEQEGAVKLDVLVEAMTNISGTAKSSSVLDVKYSLQALRRELSDQAAEALSEAAKRHDQVTHSVATAEQVAEAIREAEAGRREAAAARHAASACVERLTAVAGLAAVSQRVEELSKRMEAAESRSSQSFAAMDRKLDGLSAQVLTQLTMLSVKVAELSGPAGATAAELQKEGTDSTACSVAASGAPPAASTSAGQDSAGQSQSYEAGSVEAAKPQETEAPPQQCMPAAEQPAAGPHGDAAAGEGVEEASAGAPLAASAAQADVEAGAGAAPWQATFPPEEPARSKGPSPFRAPSEPESTPAGRAAEPDLLEAEPPEVATPSPGPSAVGSADPCLTSGPGDVSASSGHAASGSLAAAGAWAAATPERRTSADKQELKDMMDMSANEIFDKLVKQDAGDTFS